MHPDPAHRPISVTLLTSTLLAVWAAAQATPLMVGKRFFRSQVTDLAWTPDGYTLLAASSDGGCRGRVGTAAMGGGEACGTGAS